MIMKNFENFKQEIIKRCKKQLACETEFKRVLESKTFEDLIKVITDNFNWSCNHKIIDIPLLEEVGSEILNNCNIFFNVSVTTGYLLVGNATVEAGGNATVEAWGNATVEAWGNATVKAWGNAYINSQNTIEHKLSDYAICRYKYENRIVLSSSSNIETY